MKQFPSATKRLKKIEKKGELSFGQAGINIDKYGKNIQVVWDGTVS